MSDGSRARDEAEKFVATALAAASLAAKGLGTARNSAQTLQTLSGLAERFLGQGADAPRPSDDAHRHTFSNGSPECCVCPVCKMIAALRDPSPEFTERLASGASDLAAGIAGVMRAFASNRTASDLAGFRNASQRPWSESDLGDDDLPEADPWRTATRGAEAPGRAAPERGSDPTSTGRASAGQSVAPKPMAKKATRPAATTPVRATQPAKSTQPATPKKAPKKAAKLATSTDSPTAGDTPVPKAPRRAANRAAQPHTDSRQPSPLDDER